MGCQQTYPKFQKPGKNGRTDRPLQPGTIGREKKNPGLTESPAQDDPKERFRLSDAQFNLIQDDIIELYSQGLRPEKDPVVVILGGQPGCGKTELEKIARAYLGENVMVCNGDVFRDFHPDAELIKTQFEEQYPELTAGYAHAWNKGLREHCEQHRLNYILETTFSSGILMNDTIRELKDKDYRVDILLLAVHPAVSLLSTRKRFEEMKLHEKGGRLVSREAHDDRFNKLMPTLKLVALHKLYDKLEIYARDDVAERNSLQLLAADPKNPSAVFEKELLTPWTRNKQLHFEQRVQEVIGMMRERKASVQEIKAFKAEIKLPEQLLMRQQHTVRQRRGRRP